MKYKHFTKTFSISRSFILLLLLIGINSVLGCKIEPDFTKEQRVKQTNSILENSVDKVITNQKVQESYNQMLSKRNILSISLLKQEKYQELKTLFQNLENKYRSNIEIEEKIDLELDSVYNTRENLEPVLDKFIQEYPESYIPYLYRANYLTGKGWQSRGGDFIESVSQKQFQWFKHFLLLAKNDIKKSLEIDDKILFSYILSIGIISSNHYSQDEMQTNIEKSLEIRPESLLLWAKIVGTLTPRWGGSIASMQQAVDYSSNFYSLNPKLKTLKNTITVEKADQEKFKGNIKSAIELYQKEIDKGDIGSKYALGDLLINNGLYADGCNEIKQYLESNPVSWNARYLALWCKASQFK
jgi:hypothetical protein